MQHEGIISGAECITCCVTTLRKAQVNPTTTDPVLAQLRVCETPYTRCDVMEAKLKQPLERGRARVGASTVVRRNHLRRRRREIPSFNLTWQSLRMMLRYGRVSRRQREGSHLLIDFGNPVW